MAELLPDLTETIQRHIDENRLPGGLRNKVEIKDLKIDRKTATVSFSVELIPMESRNSENIEMPPFFKSGFLDGRDPYYEDMEIDIQKGEIEPAEVEIGVYTPKTDGHEMENFRKAIRSCGSDLGTRRHIAEIANRLHVTIEHEIHMSPGCANLYVSGNTENVDAFRKRVYEEMPANVSIAVLNIDLINSGFEAARIAREEMDRKYLENRFMDAVRAGENLRGFYRELLAEPFKVEVEPISVVEFSHPGHYSEPEKYPHKCDCGAPSWNGLKVECSNPECMHFDGRE
jgi:hypothetical protein